ncbi:MAG: maleylpyruvate isomerase family mycothiol-dependent enzyme [Acidimicrobiales bacterium]
MTMGLDKDSIVGALEREFHEIDDLLLTLRDYEWAAQTPCPGWDVHANVAHMIGTESSLAGLTVPDVEIGDRSFVRNEAGRSNEKWVVFLSGLAPEEMLERFRHITNRRIADLRRMSDDDWNGEIVTPAGKDTYGRFMRIRVFDCWMHEQDIRDGVHQSGHEGGPIVDLVLDEITTALGFVVGKQAGVTTGQTVTFKLSGATTRDINVAVEHRAIVVEQLEAPATVTIHMRAGLFTRICGGRFTSADAGDGVRYEGDEDLGRRIVQNLAYTI